MYQPDLNAPSALNNPLMLNRPRTVRCRIPVLILTAASLLCSLVGLLDNFLYYTGDSYSDSYQLRFTTLSLRTLLYAGVDFLQVVPAALLLLLYVAFLYKKRKTAILIPAVFAVLATVHLLYALFYTGDELIQMREYSYYRVDSYLLTILSYAIVYLGFSGLAASVIPGALKGLSKKVWIIICAAGGMSLFSLALICSVGPRHEYWWHNELYLYYFTVPASYLSYILLYLALLLFGLKNMIPSVLRVSPEQESAALMKMPPEKALKLLNQKFDQGLIAADTFQSLRAQIIAGL